MEYINIDHAVAKVNLFSCQATKLNFAKVLKDIPLDNR